MRTEGNAIRRRAALSIAALALVLTAAFATAPAQGADRVYWANFDGPEPITFADLDGTAVNPLNISGATPPEVPFGVAVDPVGGRLYWASSNGGKISYANLDGSGGGDLNTGAATVKLPAGVAVDVAARKVYWANQSGDKISWANLDGSGGGDLNTGTATVKEPTGIAVDPPSGRVYWTAFTMAGSLSYANLDGSGGADLPITGAATLEYPFGIAIDHASGRLFWSNDTATPKISSAKLDGSGSVDLNTGGASVANPYGVALDPEAGRVYWGNSTAESIAFARLDGTGGANLPFAIPKGSAPNFPVLMKTPRSVSPPTIRAGALMRLADGRRGKKKVAISQQVGVTLSCAPGSWAGDLVEAFLYRAPLSTSIQWTRDGVDIPSANEPLLSARDVGNYRCRETAANRVGTASQSTDVAAFFLIGNTKLNRKKGTASLEVDTPPGGRLALSSKGLVPQTLEGSGTQKLPILPNTRKRKILRRKGRSNASAVLTFTPSGGPPVSQNVSIALRKRLRR